MAHIGQPPTHIHTPFEDTGIYIITNYPRISIRTQQVTVTWYSGHLVEVRVSNMYQGQINGLCGNFNNNKGDDSVDRSGVAINSTTPIGLEILALSWHYHSDIHLDCYEPSYLDIQDALQPNKYMRKGIEQLFTAACNCLQQAAVIVNQ